MHTSKLSYVLVPLIALSSSVMASPKGETDDDGSSFIVSEREKVTTPGGFSSVAEPAGPIDPEAAAIYAATYQFACVIIPNLLSHATGGKPVTVHEMCTAQANTGAPLATGPTTVSNEQVARLIPHGSGINRYPSGEIFVIFKQPMMVWTSPATFSMVFSRIFYWFGSNESISWAKCFVFIYFAGGVDVIVQLHPVFGSGDCAVVAVNRD